MNAASRMGEVDLTGVIDLYVHASPDLLPRRSGDIDLARECAGAGYLAAVHRNHFSITADRSAVARSSVNFDLLGAAVLNDHVGGLDPVVAETALRCGARWIGMPTLSAAAFRSRLPADVQYADVLRMGRGDIALVDDQDALKPAVRDILSLAAVANVAVGVGYGTLAECRALCEGASDVGIDKLVLTYPDAMGLTDREVTELAEGNGLYVEICALTLHPDGLTPGVAEVHRRRVLRWLRALGPQKFVASSDGGMTGVPGPLALMTWLIEWLRQTGVASAAIDMMVRRNAATLLDI